MTVDPFAAPDVDAPKREREERNADLPDFFKMKDLVGRNVLIDVESIETVPDGKFGPYDKATAKVVIVLDGRKNELFPVFPRWQRNVWIFDNNIVSELRAFLNPKDKERFGKVALVYVTVNERNKLMLEDATTDPEAREKARLAWDLYESGADQPTAAPQSVPQPNKPPF